MWLKFILLAAIPAVTWWAVFLIYDRPLQSSRFDTYRQTLVVSLEVAGNMNKLTKSAFAFASGKDKKFLDEYSSASAALKSQLERLVENEQIEKSAANLTAKLEPFKAELADPKTPAPKLAADFESLQSAAFELESALSGVMTQKAVDAEKVGPHATTAAMIVWAVLAVIFSISCHTRYVSVRDNIKSLAAGQTLKPPSKFGCGDEISKLDRAVHQSSTKL